MVVAVLVGESTVDLNPRNRQGWTPLHVAVSQRRVTTALVLAQTPGVCLQCVTRNGRTAVDMALDDGTMEAVRTAIATSVEAQEAVDMVVDSDAATGISLALSLHAEKPHGEGNAHHEDEL